MAYFAVVVPPGERDRHKCGHNREKRLDVAPCTFLFAAKIVWCAQRINWGLLSLWRYTLPVGNGRKLPALIGLGVHKASTSYLFNLLKLHPKFKPPVQAKELMMFAEWPVPTDAFASYLNKWGKASIEPD